MFDDPWPEEPPDPHGNLGEPEAGFDIQVPEGATASRELFRAFWGLVAVFNVALFATALGALLVAFEGRLRLGGAVLAVGLAASAYGVKRYRDYRAGAPADAEGPPEPG